MTHTECCLFLPASRPQKGRPCVLEIRSNWDKGTFSACPVLGTPVNVTIVPHLNALLSVPFSIYIARFVPVMRRNDFVSEL